MRVSEELQVDGTVASSDVITTKGKTTDILVHSSNHRFIQTSNCYKSENDMLFIDLTGKEVSNSMSFPKVQISVICGTRLSTEVTLISQALSGRPANTMSSAQVTFREGKSQEVLPVHPTFPQSSPHTQQLRLLKALLQIRGGKNGEKGDKTAPQATPKR